jgi:hypothetical protein
MEGDCIPYSSIIGADSTIKTETNIGRTCASLSLRGTGLIYHDHYFYDDCDDADDFL